MDKITILGIGTAGGNVINHISEKLDKDKFDLACINTDKQLLEFSKAHRTLQIGKNTCAGLGCGGQVSVGESAAEESEEDIKNFLKDVKQLIIIAGLGGGCGTGASHIIAKYAVEMGIKTSCVLTIPFYFEGKRRKEQAFLGIELIKDIINGNFVLFYNDEISNNISDQRVGLMDAFRIVDEKVYEVLNNYILNIK